MIKCKRCGWYKNKYVNCVSCSGAEDSELVLCGEAYGGQEAEKHEKTGKPSYFVGKAGDVLKKVLKHINLSFEDVILMNAIRCYQPGNPTPTKVELNKCFPFIYTDILRIKPKLVIALGGSALYQLTGNEGIERNRGIIVFSDKIQSYVLPTYHPSACLYEGGSEKLSLILFDFRKAKNFLDKGEKPEIKHYDYEVIKESDDFCSVFEFLRSKSKLVFDIETTGLSPWKDEFKTLQLNCGEGKVFLLEKGAIYKNKRLLKRLFESDIKICGQDFGFDARFFKIKLDIFPRVWYHDTCLAEYLISGMGNNDLTALTAKYAPESFGYDFEVHTVGGAHLVKDQSVLYQYGSDDVGVIPTIKRQQKEKLLNLDADYCFNNITMPCNKVLTKMSCRGVKYDLDLLMKTDKVYEAKAEKALKEALKLPGIEECQQNFKKLFNPRSPDMVRWLLLDYYKLDPILPKKKTNTGNPTVDKKAMEQYAKGGNTYCQVMEKYRSIQNIRDNFLSGVVPKLIGDTAHTIYSLHATSTGRPNSKEPNLLNIPDKGDAGKDIKRCMIARPDHVFVYADESQVEVRVAAVIFDEPNLIEICNAGGDLHCLTTAKVYGMTYDEVYDGYKSGDVEITEKRKGVKAVVFGCLYQESAIGLAYDLGISVRKAEQFIKDFFKGFPNLERNIEKLKQKVIETGEVSTYFGFKRRWKFHSADDHNTLREAVNMPVQGTAWNLVELAIIQINDFLEKNKMISGLALQVYDSVAVEAHISEYKKVCRAVKKIMESVNKPYPELNRVKLTADVEVGKNLAELRKVL